MQALPQRYKVPNACFLRAVHGNGRSTYDGNECCPLHPAHWPRVILLSAIIESRILENGRMQIGDINLHGRHRDEASLTGVVLGWLHAKSYVCF